MLIGFKIILTIIPFLCSYIFYKKSLEEEEGDDWSFAALGFIVGGIIDMVLVMIWS